MDVEIEATRVWKRAQTAGERQVLGREAAMLRAVAHPGVVQLLEAESGEPPAGLVLRRVDGGDLTAWTDQPVEAVAGLGAALATTVADLHDLGVSHGAVTADHVLLDAQGRPVLCSFGRATRMRAGPEAEVGRRDDVRALAQLLLDLLPSGAPARTVRVLRLVAGQSRRRRGRDARWLARQLVSEVPAARLPDAAAAPVAAGVVPVAGAGAGQGGAVGGTDGDATGGAGAGWRPRPDRHRRREGPIGRRRGWRAAAVGVVGTAAVLALVLSSGSHVDRVARAPGPQLVRGPVAPVCPTVDAGCTPLPTADGMVTTPTGRYQLTGASDIMVVGRWRCASAGLPAVLRPDTGEVWTFGTWPTTATRPEVGQLVARIAGAWTLRVSPEPSGCDLLEVERRGLPAVTIDPAYR